MTDYLKFYERMLTIRLAELCLVKHYSGNLIKTPVHLANGAEAIACGILPFVESPRVFGSYRNHHWYLETTGDLFSFFAELLGKKCSPTQGRAGSMHLCHPQKGMILTSAIVSSTIPIAVGDAWAGKQQGHDGQTVVFFGDGAIEEGVFFESLNFAILKKIPLIFVCEDNGLAIHAQKKDRHSFEIKKLIEAYNVPYFAADASRIENVANVMQLAKAGLQQGPVFLHLHYFRMLEHVGTASDFQYGYRQAPRELNHVDPVWNCEQSLFAGGLAQEKIKSIFESVQQKVDSQFEECLKMPDVDAESAGDFVTMEYPK